MPCTQGLLLAGGAQTGACAAGSSLSPRAFGAYCARMLHMGCCRLGALSLFVLPPGLFILPLPAFSPSRFVRCWLHMGNHHGGWYYILSYLAIFFKLSSTLARGFPLHFRLAGVAETICWGSLPYFQSLSDVVGVSFGFP